jgi:DNA-binding transcriptional MerR regulator
MPSPFTTSEYETTAPGARLAGVSENQLRRLGDRGEVKCIRTSSGQRLYLREDLLRLQKRKEHSR